MVFTISLLFVISRSVTSKAVIQDGLGVFAISVSRYATATIRTIKSELVTKLMKHYKPLKSLHRRERNWPHVAINGIRRKYPHRTVGTGPSIEK